MTESDSRDEPDRDDLDHDDPDHDRLDREPSETDEGARGDTTAPGTRRERRSPALIATLVTIPVMVIVLFIAIAAFKTDSSDASLPLADAAAPESGNADCAALLAKLPATFAGFDDRSESGGLVQWKPTGDAAGPVQLRCGVDRPSDLAPTSALQVVDPVQWFATGTGDENATGTLWIAVDHRPYVALWLPSNSGNGPIADTSKILDSILPRASIDLGS